MVKLQRRVAAIIVIGLTDVNPPRLIFGGAVRSAAIHSGYPIGTRWMGLATGRERGSVDVV
jgi:hypothetical protein